MNMLKNMEVNVEVPKQEVILPRKAATKRPLLITMMPLQWLNTNGLCVTTMTV